MTPPPNRTRRIDRRSFLKTGALVAGSGLVTGTASATSASEITGFRAGESIDVGDGTVTAYATTTANGAVASLGVHVDGAAMDAVGDAEVEANLGFPAKTATGDALDHHQFTFVRFEYLPEGHVPKGVWDVPHFDFEFHMLDETTVEGIEKRPADYAIPKAQMPERHIRPPRVDTNDDGKPDAPLIEAQKGEVIVDLTTPELQKALGRAEDSGEFTHTHFYGAYDADGDGIGKITFFELMTDLDFAVQLDTMEEVELPTPARYFTADEYPTSYVVQPVGDGGIYVYLDDFETFPGPKV